MDSILDTIKTLLGINVQDSSFDTDVILHINSALMALSQLGVGSTTPFSIKSSVDTWNDFLGENTNIEAIKSYIFFKTKLAFDPPSNSFVIESMNRQLSELEWRINIQAESGE